MRIFDRIASGESAFDAVGRVLPELTDWRKAANTYVRVIADEASDHYWQSPKQDWSLSDGDFGVLRPPFPDMWIEWTTPRMCLAEGKWAEWPVLRYALRVHQEGDILHMTALQQQEPLSIISTHVYAQVRIDTDGVGTYDGIQYDVSIANLAARSMSQPVEPEEWVGAQYRVWSPGLLAIGLMNCKNVQLVDVAPSLQARKKRERRGHFGGLDYRQIVITDGAAKATADNRAAGANRTRLHMVRGHFAHYTAEKPLFGRVTGTFWRAWHVRGDESLGRVSHEYHVTAPAAR